MEQFTYKIEESRDGGRIIVINRNGKDFPLHSRISPEREGEKNPPEFDPAKYDLLVLLGCGMGYHLAGLRETADKYTLIIIIDIIPSIESEIRGSTASSFIVNGKNVRFISGESVDMVEARLMELVDLEVFRGVQVVEHTNSFRLFPEYYESVKGAVRRVIDKKSADRATVKAFGSIFLRNALNNFKNFSRLSPVSSLFGKFRGEGALIISSAPSVEKYIDEIKIYRNKFFIIAVDSALPMLAARGIRADFALSIDPQQRIHEHFLGHEGGATVHIFSIASPPSIVERYGGFLSINSHPVSQIIEEFYPGRIGSIDSGTGSVAGDALCFALLAGFDNIGMTGFDFSFTDNIIYARETSYQKRYSLYFNSRFMTPESFNASYIFRSSGSLVAEGRYTRRSFLGYRGSLIRFIDGRCKTPPVMINSTGLKISNGIYLEMKGFADRCDQNKGDIRLIPDKLLNESRKVEEIIDRKRIADFMDKGGVKEELLTHSLGIDNPGSRDARFLRLFI